MLDLKFLETVEAFGMFSPGDDVTVGFSGGADSVCLLSLLNKHKNTLGITVRAAHVNHGIRGEEGDHDEAFARQFCLNRDIPFTSARFDIPALAAERRLSVELCARNERYRFFQSLQGDKIATAHTLSDVEETFFMNLSRGASLHGLTSIPPVRGSVVRPLIRFTRKDTEQYCKENHLSYVTDSTNRSDDIVRNRYRHRIIPPLEELNPSFHTAFLRCVETLRCEDDYMDRAAQAAFDAAFDGEALHADQYLCLHPAIRLRVLAQYLGKTLNADYETKHLKLIDANMGRPGFALMLPGGKCVAVENVCLRLRAPGTVFSPDHSVSVLPDTPSVIPFNGFTVSLLPSGPPYFHSPAADIVDRSKIGSVLTLRCRQPGDRIRLARRNCSKTLKKLYTELHLSPQLRACAPVLADEQGVIWAYGAGADASRLADKNTTDYLIIHSESDKNDK